MIETSPKPPTPSGFLVFTGQPSISDELDMLITNFVDTHIIKVEITSAGKTDKGQLQRCIQPGRISILHEDRSMSVATCAYITELKHDLVYERAMTMHPQGALA